MNGPPPLLGRVLLRAVLSPTDHEHVVGDLTEEYLCLRDGGVDSQTARRWYLRQVVRSLLPLLMLRLQRGSTARALLTSQLLVLAPVWMLDLLWRSVLSQVPLRAGQLAPEFSIASAAVLAVLAAAAGATAVRSSTSPAALPVGLALCTALSGAVAVSALDVRLFIAPALLLALLPAAVLAGGALSLTFAPCLRGRRPQ
jgi:hypothetical protein